jgi:3,4-dihydroxy-9,10-secoandrosta-1,3,5(10)-triene-9,17-dione 4,5-dioxygenase
MELRGLGYLGVAAADPREWLRFGTQVCGLMPARILPGEPPPPPGAPLPEHGGVAKDGSVYLKMDDRQWRLAVHPGEPGLRYLGFELAGRPALDAALAALRARGVEARAGSPAEAAARGVGALVVLSDPAGHRIELFCGPLRDHGFASPVGARFLTGSLGMGHVNLFTPDVEASLDFYTRALGFQLTDFIRFGPGQSVQFLRCTPRHHTVALISVGPLSGLQHVMLEMTELDGVGQALDRALAAGVPITSSLGRHKNDRMVSFYMRSPAGFDVEIGWDGLLVGEDWVQSEFCEGDTWGHRGLTAEAIKASAER